MAEEKDFMEMAVEEYLGEPIPQEPPAPAPDTGEPPVAPATETPPQELPVEASPAVPPVFGEVDVLQKFNELAGTSFESIDKAKAFAETYKKFPNMEEQVKILPELVDALSKVENPMNYFRDEVEFKVSQLSKDERYKGKEEIVKGILNNNLEELADVKVIELASQLNAKQGVRNPLRAELRSIGVDPDDVLENYDGLDDDTKDLLKIRADQYRDKLKDFGSEIKPPSFEGTIVERLLNQKKTAVEETAAKVGKIKPIAKGIVSEIKEIPITDDFSFKLELTPQDIDTYTEELTEILSSGKYDLSTDDGKKMVYGAIVDMFRSDYFDKAVSALVSHLTSKTEERMRREFNNETPLEKREPLSGGNKDKDMITLMAEQMVSRGF